MTTDQSVGILKLSTDWSVFSMSKLSDQKREQILQAAHQVVRSVGVRSLTLDKVAKQAGVSKGGLIHHFPSKDALLEAMQKQVFEQAEREYARFLEQEPETGKKGRRLRAFLRCNQAMIQSGIPNHFVGMIELAIAAPESFPEGQNYFNQLQELVASDCDDPVKGIIILSASDYLWLQVLLGGLAGNDRVIGEIHERLIEMTY